MDWSSISMLFAVFTGLTESHFEMRHVPVANHSTGNCKLMGAPLDLLFLVDGSGSLAEKWSEQLRMVTDIIDTLAITPDATRVAFVHYSGRAVEEFSFNVYTTKSDVISAVNSVRPVNGVTRTASALKFAETFWSDPGKGARKNAKRILMLLSDGRMTPEDVSYEKSARMHREVYGAEIYAYGLGKYLDWNPLVEIVGLLGLYTVWIIII